MNKIVTPPSLGCYSARMNNHLSDEEFYSIYSKVPRLALDVVIRSDEGILLSLRAIEPHKGLWHLPGGTVYRGETI